MSKTEAEKAEAQKKIDSILTQIRQLLNEAETIADGHGLEFSYVPNNIGTYYGAGNPDHPYRYDDSEPAAEGEWYPSSWNSSSLYC